jgi:hypothetical protein
MHGLELVAETFRGARLSDVRAQREHLVGQRVVVFFRGVLDRRSSREHRARSRAATPLPR